MKNPTVLMTVGDLIRILESFPQELPILVSGYESSFESFNEPYVARLIHMPDNPYYDGEYQWTGSFQMKNGYVNYSEISKQLNQNGYRTRNGCQFCPGIVRRLIVT